MAKITGTLDGDNLFGTDDADVIRGFGGLNFMQGNGGDDRISGMGTTDAGAGDDVWSAIDLLRRYPANIGTEANMGDGDDRAVMTEHDKVSGTINYGFFDGVDMGAGNDSLFFGANAFAAYGVLGKGEDVAYVASEQSTAIYLGEFAGDREDGDRDVIHVDAMSGGVIVNGFEDHDKIVLYGMDISLSDLKLRTTFIFSDETFLKITLPNDTVIEVRKSFEGHLTADHIEIVPTAFKAKTSGMIGDSAKMSKLIFGSGGDDTIRAFGKDVFLNAGDDIGLGSGKNDGLHGQGGNDVLRGKGGNDTLTGGYGDDRILGGGGRDEIDTGAGDDFVNAGRGNDVITTFRGEKTIKAGAGDDTIIVTDVLTGVQSLSGGRGADHFVFQDRLRYDEALIRDFGKGNDKVDLRDIIPETYSAADIERVYGDFYVGRDVLAQDGYAADGLYIGQFNILFEGLQSGDLKASDFLLL